MTQQNAAIRIEPGVPAVVLAPMEGLADAPMRAVQGEIGAFTFSVSEFLRVNEDPIARKIFLRDVPELSTGGRTLSDLPVQVQLLGGHAGRMAESAITAVEAGAMAIDINFGCPARTVNRHDGGATLLKHPERIHEIVAAIRAAVPASIPVSAKLRLGWDSHDPIIENARTAADAGASWLTIHGRTKVAAYRPPAYWEPIGIVREQVGIPVVANGDIWTIDDFRRCRDVSGCEHFMLGRGALANPFLSHQVANDLGIPAGNPTPDQGRPIVWQPYLRLLQRATERFEGGAARLVLCRMKQWLKLAADHEEFDGFESVKRTQSVEELFSALALLDENSADVSEEYTASRYAVAGSLH